MALFNTHYPYMGGAAKTFEPIVYAQNIWSSTGMATGVYNNLPLNTQLRTIGATAISTVYSSNIFSTVIITPEQFSLSASTANAAIDHKTYTYSSTPSHKATYSGDSRYVSSVVVAYPYANGEPDYIIFVGRCYRDSDGDYYPAGLCNTTTLTTTDAQLIRTGKYYMSGYFYNQINNKSFNIYIDGIDYGGNSSNNGLKTVEELTITTGNVRMDNWATSNSFGVFLLWKK